MTWFRFEPSATTALAVAAAVACVALSATMPAVSHSPWLTFVVRDLLQITLVGLALPVVYLWRTGRAPAELGLSLHGWRRWLLVDSALGVALLALFLIKHPPPPTFQLDADAVAKGAYVALALFFELIFFYAFLRTLLCDAFGAVPGVMLAAGVYALHHIGFQPELGKLLWVGLMYAGTVQLTRSALSIFPFFLGVGGVYDVLHRSQVVAPIAAPGWRALGLSVAAVATLLALRRLSPR